MASETNSRIGGANIWLALAAGLAVGFAVGREMGPRSGSGEATADARPAAPAAHAAPSGPSYKTEGQFPANWKKAADLVSVKGVTFDGLNDGQKATALQALNERKCNCGCGMESIALCAQKDPNCPKSPKLVKDVVDLVKQGKTLTDVYAYLDKEAPPSPSAPQAAPPPPGPKKVAIPAHSPRKGPKAPKVTIVEFSDFQCPFCGRAEASLKEVLDKYPKDVAVVYVNQPLSFHPNAMPAALAFMAAARQGKGWEMHDKMFANQTALSQADLDKYAQEIGLNMARFKKDLGDPKIQDEIKADQALASSVGADGTPTFFINGRQLVGAEPFPNFKTIIDDEVKKADELLKKGTKPDQLYTKLNDQNVAAAPVAPAAAAAAPAPAEKVDIAIGDAPVKGPANAPVTIVEFSDFQCPFCSRVVPTLKQIEDTYKGKVKVAFKNFPLDFHQYAQTAAEASMAAHEQGKFWEMHDKLFANQQQLDRASLDRYAQELGLNMARFKAALDSGKFRERVKKDQAEASKVGVGATPTLFVNGHKLEGAQPFEAFKTEIDKGLAGKGK
jgi:protein-disulfide isomerase